MKNLLKKIGTTIITLSIILNNISISMANDGNSKEFRGVWISTVYRTDYPSVQNDIEAQKAEFSEKLDKLQAVGINAVVVQIRPEGDAFYKSELNPWGSALTGVQGQDPGYDPMEFMIEETHSRGMEFHAWMNPYRITKSGTDLNVLSDNNMAKKNPSWVITYNNALYYNPELPEVKEYIKNTVGEVVKNYNVDAIHFDDYFYPANYPLSEGEGIDGNEANTRREHINDMIRIVSQEIKSINPEVEFGISPMGIWKNSTSDSEGSATNGTEGYYSVYGDAKTWIEENLVDYIVPQIYWETGNVYADYETLVKWWSDLTKDTDVTLYIGQGIYKDIVSEEITKQLTINENYDVDGSIFFSGRDIFENRFDVATSINMYYSNSEINPIENEITTPEIIDVEPEIIEPDFPQTIETKNAYVSNSSLRINDVPVKLEAYIIDDYTYFKLRDIAYYVNGTEKQFDTLWNESNQSISLLTNSGYSGGMIENSMGIDTIATTSTAKLYLNDEEKNVSAFNINGYTYYKLRDIAKLLDMGVSWDETILTIGINTETSYE